MDAAPFGQGPRVKGEPMNMAPLRAVTTRHRHPASLSSSAGERGGRAAPVSRGRMGTSTRTPTDTLCDVPCVLCAAIPETQGSDSIVHEAIQNSQLDQNAHFDRILKEIGDRIS